MQHMHRVKRIHRRTYVLRWEYDKWETRKLLLVWDVIRRRTISDYTHVRQTMLTGIEKALGRWVLLTGRDDEQTHKVVRILQRRCRGKIGWSLPKSEELKEKDESQHDIHSTWQEQSHAAYRIRQAQW
jgi:hypothetical protein